MTYTVENITSKEVNTKFGPKPSYTVIANGERFNHGFKKPAFKIGDTIQFTFSEGKYGNDIEVATVRVVSSGGGGVPAAAPTPAAKPAYGPPVKPFPIPALHGDRAIIRQNALTNSRELITSLPGHFLDMDKAYTPKEIADMIINVARMFEAYSAGDIDMEAAMAELIGEK